MKKLLPLLFFISLLATACKVEPITATGVEDVKLGNVDPLKGTVSLDLGLKLKNPNKVSVTVYTIDLDVSINGAPLGHIALADKVKIEKDTEQVYRVKANAKLTDIIAGIPKILAAISKKQSKVEVKGSIRAGVGIFKHTFPIDLKQEQVQTGKQ
jgi:LEA14-like dessication related protein